MYRTFLSWRYLISRGINLIGITGIFVAVGALILILSIMSGFLEESKSSIRGNLSDVIVAPEHMNRPDRREVPVDPDRLLEVIRSDDRVQAASAHLVWYGMLIEDATVSTERMKHSRFGHHNIVQYVGVDLEDELGATELLRALDWSRDGDDREGTAEPVADLADPFATPPGYRPWGLPKSRVILGKQMMDNLRIRRGDVVKLATGVPDERSGEMRFHDDEYVVAGAFWTGENEMDLERLYLEREELQALVGDVRGFSEVLVKLVDYDRDAALLTHDLRHGLGALGLIRGRPHEVKTWEEFRGPLLGAIENERVLMGIMLSLVLLVAGFTVFAILSMMVTEKTRDIGILTALGATPRGILQLFILIGFWDALLGALLGTVAGVSAALHIDAIERWLSQTFGVEIFRRDVYVFDHIPSIVHVAAVTTIVLGAFLVTLLFAAVPAWRAARLDPLQALRYE